MKPRITVFGVGGAGGNAVNNMIQSQLEGVDFVVANTDAQALEQSRADLRIQLGTNITQGLGAGSRPDVGHAAAEEAMEDILQRLADTNMVFITAGMGGGTGTGAAPVIARAAREQGILTVGVVTKPFHFEGAHRMRIAEAGIEEMEQFVDTLIIIPNQNLFRVANERTTFADAFKMADDVLYAGVRGVTDLMVMPGLINLDFADIRSVMSEMGKAMMGTGEAEGERRALDAAEAAIANPLLDDTTMNGATGVLINITGGSDMTLFEVDEAANRIRSEVDPEAHIIFGSTFDDSLEGRMRVSIVATGMDADVASRPVPTLLEVTKRPAKPRTVETHDDGGEAAVVAEAQANVVEMRQVPAEMAELSEPVVAEQPTLIEEEEEAAATGTDDAIPAPSPARPAPAAPTASARDAFIPPVPAERSGGRLRERQADPFAAAAMANGAGDRSQPVEEAPRRPRGASLFERVTGTGRGAKPAVAQPAPTQARSEPVAPQRPAEPEQVESQQTKLGGLDPSDRISGSRNEEDLLDIPAFLRRQAN